jgi:chromosome segregation ATPase
MRKPRRTAEPARPQGAALTPVWVEADELLAFKAWWNRLAAGERNARSAFLHGLQRADAAWSVVYRQLGDELQKSRESVRTAEKELAGMRSANERIRNELDQAIDRANEAEERVKNLTTPVPREYE